MYDIAIIGAGPAGSTLARLLPPTMKVLILDKRNLESGERLKLTKACGGLIAPDAQKEICRMGLGLPLEVMEGPQLFGVQTLDLNHRFERVYQRYYYNINREKFDRWLFSLIPDRVERITGIPLLKILPLNNAYELQLRDGRKIQCRKLIGADGGNSTVRRFILKGKDRMDKYLSIQEWFHQPETDSHYRVIFDQEITDFYSWTISKGPWLILGSALPAGSDGRRKFERLKQKLTDRGYNWGEPHKREGAWILRPRKPGHICYGEKKILLIGEAAGWISPSSAEGLSFALRSAAIAAEVLSGYPKNPLREYRNKSGALRLSLYRKWLKSPGMYWPSLRKLVLMSGFGSVALSTNMLHLNLRHTFGGKH